MASKGSLFPQHKNSFGDLNHTSSVKERKISPFSFSRQSLSERKWLFESTVFASLGTACVHIHKHGFSVYCSGRKPKTYLPNPPTFYGIYFTQAMSSNNKQFTVYFSEKLSFNIRSFNGEISSNVPLPPFEFLCFSRRQTFGSLKNMSYSKNNTYLFLHYLVQKVFVR